MQDAGTAIGTAWSEALAQRFAQAGYDPSVIGKSWLDPSVSGDAETARYRAQLLRDLEASETWQGPPTLDEMDRRLQREADADPDMPPWINRPWYVPKGHMLAAEAILVEHLGLGYSATGTGWGGRDHLRGLPFAPGLDVVLNPVPGMIPQGRAMRDTAERMLTTLLEKAGLPKPRVVLLWDAEPAKAFQGMLSGRIIRAGHIAVGVEREYAHHAGEP